MENTLKKEHSILLLALCDSFIAFGKAGGNTENGPFRAEWLAARKALQACGVSNI